MKHFASLIAAGTLAAAAALSASPALAQTKTVLKAADVHPMGYPTVEAVVQMGKKLEKATNGRITIQMFPSMQLGGEKEMIEQAQVGALQLARVSVGPVGAVVDNLNVFNLPFVFRNTAHMRAVIDGPLGDRLLKEITDNPKSGLVGLAWMDSGARSFYNKTRDIKTVEDLKGLKFRMMGNPIFVDTANALGANGVAMGMDQVMNGLQTGVVDGAENNPPSYDSFGHVPVAKHYSLTEHLIIPEILVYSKKSFDSLSKEDQALVLKFGKETQLEERALWDVRTKQAMDKIKAAGVNVIEIKDKKPFQDAVKPVWDKYGAKYADLVKQIQDTK